MTTQTSDELTKFRAALKDADRSPRTITGYLQDLTLFARWFEHTNGETLSPQGLTPTDVREYRQHLLRRKIAPATINRHLAALRAFATWAVDIGLLEDNPIGVVRGVKEQKHAPKWLDRKAQARLLREVEKATSAARTDPARVKAARDYALVNVLLNTGLRVSELCALETGDIPQLGERSGRLVVREGKGCKHRELPLNADARRALTAWLKVRPKSDLTVVFFGRRGEPLTTSGINRLLDEYGRRAGVEVTPHRLRHSFGKNLVDAGISLDRVAALMGHTKLETTRLYTLPGERDLEMAVEALET